jgi:GDPmannose 4,6-dehydratase
MKILITGITGQDGYYLSEQLLEQGHEVHGLIRRSSNINTIRIDPLIAKFGETKQLQLYYSDLLDSSSLTNLINKILPDEIYNLAAQSHVAVSFKNPIYSTQSGTLGTITILDSLRNIEKPIKFYQASSSEMFGGVNEEILDENSILYPKSPYAAAKVFSHNITKIYRESYGIFAVNGILFNHESPLRGETFVTRKITRAVGRIYFSLQNKLTLGNLDASRDWGFAGDYTKGMQLMMKYDLPDDWVLATGETHTVKEFAEKAFRVLDLNWEEYVLTSDKYKRPNEVNYLLGNPSKAIKKLDWKIETSFDSLIEMMVESDLENAKREKVLIENGLLKPTWEHPI